MSNKDEFSGYKMVLVSMVFGGVICIAGSLIYIILSQMFFPHGWGLSFWETIKIFSIIGGIVLLYWSINI